MQPLRIVCVSACLVGLVAAPRANAEEGEFQLGLGTSFLGYGSTTVEPEDGDETTTSGITWGIAHEVFAELGYGITPNLLVGGLVQLGGTSTTDEINDEETDNSTFDFLIGPKLDYVLIPGDKMQPFIGGVIGYVRSSESTEVGPDAETTASGFTFMARGGLRIFPGKEFSIDPWLGLGYTTGSYEFEAGDLNFDGDFSGWNMTVYVTLSGWM